MHSIFVYNYYYPKNLVAVDTIFCFPLGYFYSLIKNNFDGIIMKNDICYFGITSLIILIYYRVFYIKKLFYICIKHALFSIIVVIISMKVKINNDFLRFLNSHSFSIYLLQKIVTLIVYKKQIFKDSDFIKISFEFSSIFFLSSLFDKSTTFIDKFAKKKLVSIYNKKYISLENKKIINNIIIK